MTKYIESAEHLIINKKNFFFLELSGHAFSKTTEQIKL